ncbi:MAG: methyltransferase domain-containing protein [Halobacteriales archaeon]
MSERLADRTVVDAYDRWARPYAALSANAPLLARFRRRAVEALALDEGDVAVDVGCGPGDNLAHLARAVGPDGTVVGVDASAGMLRAAARRDLAPVQLVRGDAASPPVAGPIDGVLSTFVVTLFEDPGAVVDAWWSRLGPGGHLALLNLAPARGTLARALNLGLAAGLALSTPTREALDRPLLVELDRRVTAAHRSLADRAVRVHHHEAFGGAVRIAVGVNADGRDQP